MSLHTYIGARYVPRFMGTYDATQIYDALDVVDNGSGTSYIARKTVPAGTPLIDTDYWFVYGASSGAIVQLQNDMIAAQNDILDLNAYKEDIESERVYLFMADSYDAQNNYIDNVGQYIKCKSFTKRSYTGAGFFKYDSPHMDKTFYNILTNLDPLTASEKATITDVAFCVAGGNDNPQTTSDLPSAMSQIDTYLRVQCPKLKRIHLYPLGWSGKGALQDRIRANMSTYCRVAPALGWIYVDCTRVMKSCAYISPSDTDAYHPTAAGATRIERCLTNAIISGSCSYEISNPEFSYTYTPSFSANMGTPSWVDPASGKFTLQARVKSSGEIEVRGGAIPFIIQNIDVPTGQGWMQVTLTPDTTNMDVVPTILNMAKPLTIYGSGDYVFLNGWLCKRTDGSLQLRFRYRNSTGATLTGYEIAFIVDDFTL